MALHQYLIFLVSAGFVLGASQPAYAVGGSGACSDSLGGPLGTALKTGQPEQVEQELRKWVAYTENNLPTTKKMALSFGGDDTKTEWRNQQALDFIEGTHEEGAICVPGPLLPVAVEAGNIQVVRFLLGTPWECGPESPRTFCSGAVTTAR